jgi:hypothetical protein
MLNAFFPANIALLFIHRIDLFSVIDVTSILVVAAVVAVERVKKSFEYDFSQLSAREKLILLIEKGFVCVCVYAREERFFFRVSDFPFSHKRC